MSDQPYYFSKEEKKDLPALPPALDRLPAGKRPIPGSFGV